MSERKTAAALARWSAKLDKRAVALDKCKARITEWYTDMRNELKMREGISRVRIMRTRIALRHKSKEVDEIRDALKRQSVQMQKAHRQKRAIRRAALNKRNTKKHD